MTIAIVIACTITAAVLAGIGVLIWRARSDRPGRPIPARPVYQLPPEVQPHLEESHKPALEPPREIHVHVHVADATQAAAIIRQAIPGPSGDAGTEDDRR